MTALARLAAALADRYRVERELGSGGMATVWLAQDLKHDRKVAIKVLRPELAAAIGPERFLAEIRLTANLQHPHILPLFDSGQCDGSLFYVMPYVVGESLRDRLGREKQLPVADAVRLAQETASALDYAHRQGIVHRDIKPENILLHDDRALVADFGIALAASKAGGARLTETGMSLGTPSYMSPEQAMGEREIGPRSDVYALGAMLYEMLVGEPPFTGPTAQVVVAKAMTERPMAPSRLRDTIPPAVEDAVLTALQKLPADRFPSAKGFADALSREPTGPRAAATQVLPAAAAAGPWKRAALVSAACALAGLAFGASTLLRRPAAAGPRVYDAGLPDSAPMAYAAGASRTGFGIAHRKVSVAPDGSFVVYALPAGTSSRLWYRSLRDATARPVPGTADADAPRISPDGRHVAFFAGNRVQVAPLDGGEPRTLMEAHAASYLLWLSPTSLIVGNDNGLRVDWLDPETGPVRRTTSPSCLNGHWNPELRVLVCRGIFNAAMVVDIESGEQWPIRTTASDGGDGVPLIGAGFRIVGRDLLVFVSAEGELRAASYDAAAHRIGRPVTLRDAVRTEALGDAQYDIAADGTLVYAPGRNAEVGRIVRYRPGAQPVPLTDEAAVFQRFDPSADGRWLAAVVQTTEGQELRIYDQRGGQRTVWLRADVVQEPRWSPSGDRLVVNVRTGDRRAIVAGTPGSGRAPDTLLAGDAAAVPVSITDYPNDRELLGLSAGATFRANPTTVPLRFDTLLAGGYFVAVAPGGRLMAYMNRLNTSVLVTSHPVPGRRWQVAADGAEPLWLSASELLYRFGSSWYLARVDPVTGEPRGAPTLWGQDPRFSDTYGWSNRLTHDGGIAYVQGPPETSGAYLRVVPGWVAEARRAVAQGGQ